MIFPKRALINKRIVPLVILMLILSCSLYLRLFGFYLPHKKVDELQYLSLAMKLDAFGIRGYNFQGVNLRADNYYLYIFPAERGKPGNFFSYMSRYNKFTEEMPLFNKPPLLPLSLMFTHRLIASRSPYEAVIADIGSSVKHGGPAIFRRTQFYCVVIPVTYSLFLIAATFLLGRILFSPAVGLWAAALVSVSPIELLVSQKVLTDDMLSFFLR